MDARLCTQSGPPALVERVFLLTPACQGTQVQRPVQRRAEQSAGWLLPLPPRPPGCSCPAPCLSLLFCPSLSALLLHISSDSKASGPEQKAPADRKGNAPAAALGLAAALPFPFPLPFPFAFPFALLFAACTHKNIKSTSFCEQLQSHDMESRQQTRLRGLTGAGAGAGSVSSAAEGAVKLCTRAACMSRERNCPTPQKCQRHQGLTCRLRKGGGAP